MCLEWLFLTQILEYCQRKAELQKGTNIPDELHEGQYLEGLGEEGIVSLCLPLLESLFRCASRTWPGTVFRMFAPTSPPVIHNDQGKLHLLISTAATQLPMPPTTSEDEMTSSSEDKWMYPPSSTPLPMFKLPCLILHALLVPEDFPPLNIPLQQFEELQVDTRSKGHPNLE